MTFNDIALEWEKNSWIFQIKRSKVSHTLLNLSCTWAAISCLKLNARDIHQFAYKTIKNGITMKDLEVSRAKRMLRLLNHVTKGNFSTKTKENLVFGNKINVTNHNK